jgi:hypothetical protein
VQSPKAPERSRAARVIAEVGKLRTELPTESAEPVAPPEPATRVARVPEELIAALGTAPDSEIAARFGRTESSARSLRLDRGIPPSIAGREKLILDTLAAHPEWSLRRVAREVGVAVTTVISTRERAERGHGYTQMEAGQKASTRRMRRRASEPGDA